MNRSKIFLDFSYFSVSENRLIIRYLALKDIYSLTESFLSKIIYYRSF